MMILDDIWMHFCLLVLKHKVKLDKQLSSKPGYDKANKELKENEDKDTDRVAQKKWTIAVPMYRYDTKVKKKKIA